MAIDPQELLRRQKEIMGGVHYKSGVHKFDPRKNRKSTQELLVEEVNKVKDKIPDAMVMQPPGVKSFTRASGKVDREYDGDWDRIKDLNRCTLVVPSKAQIEFGYQSVKEHFQKRAISADNSLQYYSEKVIRPDNDPINNPCGYSGYTVFVRTHDFKKAEVQINYPAFLYAKSLPEFRDTLGEGAVSAMWVKYAPVPGGLGHIMYERWQNHKSAQIGKDAAAASKMYYDYFTSPLLDRAKGQKVLEALGKLNLPGVTFARPFRSA